ncbi:MAG TPA: lipoate--protein ligase [Gemmatimonadaceae bacterium]|nr:lipoate--protein ligase [Gemmatimonadaceae bacterium]
MRFLDNGGTTDPTLNLALEEYALLTLDLSDSYLLFYVNRPSIIIGKHQNTIEEIDADFVHAHDIAVVRRISGGGAVYHDLGNLSFSFITRYSPQRFNNYAEFTGPVVEALRELGVPAERTGRNDIVVEGRKVSGNAQVVRGERMFSHGTLLLDSNLDDVTRALKPKPGKVESKGIQSVRSRVANISEFLAAPLAMDDFRAALLAHFFPGGGPVPVHEFSADDRRRVEELANTKYRTWDWNYGESPPFNLQRTQRFPSGEVDVRLDVVDGIIKTVRVFGDFFSSREIADLERGLTGVRYRRDDLAGALRTADGGSFVSGVSESDLLSLIF